MTTDQRRAAASARCIGQRKAQTCNSATKIAIAAAKTFVIIKKPVGEATTNGSSDQPPLYSLLSTLFSSSLTLSSPSSALLLPLPAWPHLVALILAARSDSLVKLPKRCAADSSSRRRRWIRGKCRGVAGLARGVVARGRQLQRLCRGCTASCMLQLLHLQCKLVTAARCPLLLQHTLVLLPALLVAATFLISPFCACCLLLLLPLAAFVCNLLPLLSLSFSVLLPAPNRWFICRLVLLAPPPSLSLLSLCCA